MIYLNLIIILDFFLKINDMNNLFWDNKMVYGVMFLKIVILRIYLGINFFLLNNNCFFRFKEYVICYYNLL